MVETDFTSLLFYFKDLPLFCQILQRLDQLATGPKKRLVKSPKLYFYDVGLVSYLLGVKKTDHLSSLPNKGSLFENFVVADFLKRAYHGGESPNLYFYRDSAGYEVDLVLDSPGGPDLYEIKMGATYSADFSKNINYYCRLDKTSKRKSIIYSGEGGQEVDGIQLIGYHQM